MKVDIIQDENVKHLIPPLYILNYHIIPLRLINNILEIGIDQTDIRRSLIIKEIEFITTNKVRYILCSTDEIISLIEKYYSMKLEFNSTNMDYLLKKPKEAKIFTIRCPYCNNEEFTIDNSKVYDFICSNNGKKFFAYFKEESLNIEIDP